MRKVTARAHSNIALVKYWGKRDIPLNLPAVASISLTLDALYTQTSVAFDSNLENDRLILNEKEASEKETKRLSSFLNLIRKKAGINSFAHINSTNNFPTSAGLASSASAFAAATVAGCAAAEMELTDKQLSELARIGSGSAARSIYGGFAEMKLGRKTDGSDAFAVPLYGPDYWDLTVLIAITSEKKKKTGSTDGMEASRLTSPYYDAWIKSSKVDMREMRKALKDKDFEKVADISEYSCLKMHALALATNPGLIYWNGTTVDLMHQIRMTRSFGVPVFFTIDAGPQVKAICPTVDATIVKEKMMEIPGVVRIIETKLGPNARIVEAG